MMRCWLSFLVFSSMTLVACAEGGMPLSKPAARKEITREVEQQLAAFRANNWPAAYACASNAFRERFAEEAFVVLITRNYPHVWKNVRAEIGLARDDGANAHVPVRVFIANGASADYEYLLVKEKVSWRVAGVLPAARPGPGI